MSSGTTSRPAGNPSSTATTAGPCDSPAVVKRSMRQRPPLRAREGALLARAGTLQRLLRGCAGAFVRPLRPCVGLLEAEEAERLEDLLRAFLLRPARLLRSHLVCTAGLLRRPARHASAVGAFERRPVLCALQPVLLLRSRGLHFLRPDSHQIELVCGDRLIRVRYFDELHIISLHLQHTALRRARLARPVAVGGALGGYQELRSRAFIRGSDEDEQRVVVWKEVSRLERLL